MTDAYKVELLCLKGMISEMPPEDQAKVFEAHKQLEEIVVAAGDFGMLALALVGMEKAS